MKHRLKQSPIQYFAAILLCVAFALLAVPTSFADAPQTARRTVKVAFPSQSGMSEVGNNGDLLGYNYVYLQSLAEYAGWNVEYITYEDMSANDGIMTAMQQVMTGEADLLGPILRSEAIETMFEFPKNNYGVVYTTLCALEKSNITSVNYAHCVPLRVAVYAGATTRNQEVQDYLEQIGLAYELIECETTEEQLACLENGVADVLSSITLSYFEGTRAVAEFAPRPYYFVSTKGNAALVEELDAAVEKLNYTRPKMQKELQESYFGDTSGGYVLTDDEKTYLAGLNTLNVLCADAYAPYCYQTKGGAPAGVLVSILDGFAKDNEIQIRFTFCDGLEALKTQWESGSYNCMIGLPFTASYCVENGLIRSAAAMDTSLVIYGRQGTKPYKESTVAVYGDFFEERGLDIFANIVAYPTLRASLEAVEKGEADYGCTNQLSADYAIFENAYTFVTTPLLGETMQIEAAVSTSMDVRFLSALNKYINTLPSSTVTTYLSEASRHEDIDAARLFVHSRPLLVAALAAGMAVLAATLAASLFGTARRKKWALQLQKANEAMQQATKAKSDFLSRMSHEIRTPLNAIIGYMTIAQMKDSDGEKIQHCMENSELAAKHLLSIINDVLDVSAIESGRIKIASVDYNLKQQISTVSTIFYNQAKNRDVNFEVKINGLTEEWVIGDQLRVNQIVMNLLSNAVKFTPPNGHVMLSVSQLEKTEERVSIEFKVSDTGIGMSKEYLSRMFTPFEQESAGTAQKYGGTGLGLAISKNLTSLMNGTLTVESEQNVGTTFTVTIPFGVSAENAKLANAGRDFSTLRVLVVDDVQEDGSYVQEILKRLGVKSDTVTDGAQAVKRFCRRQNTDYAFDLCIIDWKMPGTDGLTVARQIREKSSAKVPIIIATAYDVTEVEQEAKSAGIDRIIAKPLFQSTLLDLLVTTFGKYEPKGDKNSVSAFALQGARILLAEDNEMNMEIAVSILSKAGIVLDTAVDGKQALEKYKAQDAGHYAAILMDVQMPVMDGYAATKAIRTSGRPDAKTIPIIAMTANAFTEDITRAHEAGMDGHIAKPVDYEKLYHTLSDCIHAAEKMKA